MKKYWISILWTLCLTLAFNSYAEHQINKCNCLEALRGYNQLYKKAWIGSCTEKSHSQSYPYYLISASIKSRMISDPSLYSEYYHNLHVFNESLINFLNYKMNECDVWPTLFEKNRDKARNDILKAVETNDEVDQYVKNRARLFYESCYRSKHLNLTVLYDHGFLEFVEGNADKSAELAEKYIRLCKEHNIDHQSSLAELMVLGQSYMETAQYSKAIEVLSDLIQKDPTNQEAYFHRASAYFETGNFDEAVADFLSSDSGNKIVKSASLASKEFTLALTASLQKGTSESIVDFVPSLCHSAYGLSTTLWALHWSTSPFNPEALSNVKNFANASYEMGTCIVNYCKNIDAETLDGYVDQVKLLYQQYDQLNDAQKGELIGYTIGRYGVDIFVGAMTGTAAGKGIQYANKMAPLCRNLRNANRICNFEAILISETKKKAILLSSLAHAAEREAYFKTVKINWYKQNKHIPGEHNFLPDRGKILIEKAELEALAKKYAGKGQRISGPILEANYKERVDFGKIIGEYALKEEGRPVKYFSTSKGIITYAKDGSMHVWPSDPGAIIK